MPLTTSPLEQVEEVVHNITVADPYRWLEDRQSLYTEAWIADQNLKCDTYFSGQPALVDIAARVAEYLNVETIDQPAQVGDKLFFRRRAKDEQQGSIWVRDISTGHERNLVDPSSGGDFKSVALHHISIDGALLAYEIRYGGQSINAIGIVHVPSGRILPDLIRPGYVRGFAFASDLSGFYYCHEVTGDTGDHSIRFHRFGQPSNESDLMLFSAPRTPSSRLRLAADRKHLGAIYSYSLEGDPAIDFSITTRERGSEWCPVFQRARAPYSPTLKQGRIFVYTAATSGNDHVIEISRTGTFVQEVVPAYDIAIHQLAFVGNRIYVEYQVDQMSKLRSWTLSGQFSGDVLLPVQGTAHLSPCLVENNDVLFYTCESFTDPMTVFRLHPHTGISSPWSKKAECPQGQRYLCSLRRVRFPSVDGSEIPMFLIGRTDLAADLPRPTIMTTYGGFGISMTPQFSVLVSVMLEQGAIFAAPSIRGGSEFGRAWYEAARGKRRQVSFDDFIAAAQWLCDQKITTPEQLAIFGGSNSGLIVGVAMTQRPDLFRAVLCIAPLLDMVRYEQFDDARKARSEYGTVETLEEFVSLYSYSPYHRVQTNVNYPATLFVSGDKDTRCNPAHVRKMAALLQGRTNQTSNILVDYSPERGHSATLPLSVRIDALSRRICFLCRELGIGVPTGGQR
jgi:prolyl oligopeptidase